MMMRTWKWISYENEDDDDDDRKQYCCITFFFLSMILEPGFRLRTSEKRKKEGETKKLIEAK